MVQPHHQDDAELAQHRVRRSRRRRKTYELEQGRRRAGQRLERQGRNLRRDHQRHDHDERKRCARAKRGHRQDQCKHHADQQRQPA
jgi:hypothetical protein